MPFDIMIDPKSTTKDTYRDSKLQEIIKPST